MNDDERLGLFVATVEGLLVRNQFLTCVAEATHEVVYVGNVVGVAQREGLFKAN